MAFTSYQALSWPFPTHFFDNIWDHGTEMNLVPCTCTVRRSVTAFAVDSEIQMVQGQCIALLYFRVDFKYLHQEKHRPRYIGSVTAFWQRLPDSVTLPSPTPPDCYPILFSVMMLCAFVPFSRAVCVMFPIPDSFCRVQTSGQELQMRFQNAA